MCTSTFVCWTQVPFANKWTPFFLNFAETYKGGQLAEEKCGEPVWKEILPWESWSNRTHLQKHGSVLTDMCFINGLQFNSDTSCPIFPSPEVNSGRPSAKPAEWLLFWICQLPATLPTKGIWVLCNNSNGTDAACTTAGQQDLRGLRQETWRGQRSLGSSGSALCSGLIWD